MKVVVAAVVALLVATTAFAKEVNFTGCTSDARKVSLHLTLSDSVKSEVEKHIASTFEAVARLLTVDELQSGEGFDAFQSALTAEDIDAIDSLHGAPQVVGSCK